MERLQLYCRGEHCGEAVMKEAEGRLEICAQMRDPGDGLYRAVLMGERGELSLGVMEPKDGMLVLRRRPQLCDVARIGAVRSVQVGCSFSFRKKSVWQKTDCPGELFRDPFLRAQLSGQGQAWWKRTEERLSVAFPLRTDAAFPLEALFCFARAEHVEGTLCMIFAFDRHEMPLQIGNL